MKKPALVFLSFSVGVSWGQLTQVQKQTDFENLASLFVTSYAPAQWKLQLFGYNLDKISPWLAQVQQTTDDISFYEVMAEYVASLNDAHSLYLNPSDFVADLKFTCDIYDGKVLIDSIDRKALPAGKFSFQIGDELVMVDGRTPDDYIKDFSRFRSSANPISTSRETAGRIPLRLQYLDPRAEELGSAATVVIRRQAGNLETYTIPWVKSGTPLTKIGPTPTPQKAGKNPRLASPISTWPSVPEYLRPLLYLRKPMHLTAKEAVLNFDALPPVFNLPQGFVQRLGSTQGDLFYTGTYQSGGKTIGYIRIPDFAPFDPFFAEMAFDTEIAYMEQNTQGLVVDVMRNPGGDPCYAEDLMSRLVTQPFHDYTVEFRPNIYDVQSFQQAVQQAIAQGAPAYQVAVLQQDVRIVTRAYQQGALTTPIPLCSFGTTRAPNTDSSGKLAVYDKPILLLTDEFSASGADLFAAMFQDAKRGKNFGARTMGAGGAVSDGNEAGYYSQGSVNVTVELIIRANPIVTPDYPTAPLIENIGVRPEVENDYMTKSNLLNGGADYVNAFTAQILSMIGK
jgi:C-terminal processing protease CtpA/Prc